MVKEFLVYTGLRLLLLIGTFLAVVAVWSLVADRVNIVWAVVVAFLISGVGSYLLLRGPREAFARRVELRAQRASEAFEQRKAKEDQDPR